MSDEAINPGDCGLRAAGCGLRASKNRWRADLAVCPEQLVNDNDVEMTMIAIL
ncbi:uncharacterized protein GLRG_06677 [Colletotrichum graminicola M1.001]|uniref:Uncharacterized protein n=1 Tax=Colletotrichum graminicola (strain M1.001 / M2 / FGSC 10212) TaxID=645133 RepID=E3QLG4_COLGM|nr:uncharacterized protein GLRG_06677 [Colletotrichum graminicola M1.001]EFQ31702.1 hypothetical protein GLRG_06677 [Colletotrichum graminicola M1.001]